MKKTLIIILSLLCIMITGCKTTELTPDSAYKAGSSAGLATGYFVKLSSIDDDSKRALVSITSDLSNIIPTNSQSFTEIWLPIAQTKINEYCEKKNLNNDQKQLINSAVIIITDALDHLFVKNVKFQSSADIALSAINGFCTSFNYVMNPSNGFASKMTYDVDSEMYMYLKAKFAK